MAVCWDQEDLKEVFWVLEDLKVCWDQEDLKVSLDQEDLTEVS